MKRQLSVSLVALAFSMYLVAQAAVPLRTTGLKLSGTDCTFTSYTGGLASASLKRGESTILIESELKEFSCINDQKNFSINIVYNVSSAYIQNDISTCA